MNDLDRLIETLTALNLYHAIHRDEKGATSVILEEPPRGTSEEREKYTAFVPYTGYGGFAWIVSFNADGGIKEVGGYE